MVHSNTNATSFGLIEFCGVSSSGKSRLILSSEIQDLTSVSAESLLVPAYDWLSKRSWGKILVDMCLLPYVVAFFLYCPTYLSSVANICLSRPKAGWFLRLNLLRNFAKKQAVTYWADGRARRKRIWCYIDEGAIQSLLNPFVGEFAIVDLQKLRALSGSVPQADVLCYVTADHVQIAERAAGRLDSPRPHFDARDWQEMAMNFETGFQTVVEASAFGGVVVHVDTSNPQSTQTGIECLRKTLELNFHDYVGQKSRP